MKRILGSHIPAEVEELQPITRGNYGTILNDCFLRDCFLKTSQDTDNTVYTEFHGKIPRQAALFRVVREIRVPKSKRQRFKKHSLMALATHPRD